MSKNYEPRHIALAIAVAIALLSLILIVFIPQIVADLVHHSSGVWQVFVPKENMIVYGIGLFLLFLAAFILFLMNFKKRGILISIVCILLSAIPFYIGSQSYIIFSNDSIVHSPILSTSVKEYAWNDLESVIYYEAEKREQSEYVFTFLDGHSLTFEDKPYFLAIMHNLKLKLAEIHLHIERVTL